MDRLGAQDDLGPQDADLDQHDTVIATGVSQGKADSLMRGHPDRVAVPEKEAETRERLARLDAEAAEHRRAIEDAGHVTRVDVSW